MHEQAFHTSCRRGLTSQPGYQFNAASAGLTETALNALATHLAGYHAPRDLPLEPAPDEITEFPVALTYCDVPGVGPSLSRTAYVGREFRGADGEPDSGRFGNYFSHIVCPAEGRLAFDGLLPIELWEAAHWTMRESAVPELPPLDALAPGPLDLEGAIERLRRPPRERWLAAVVSAIGSAVAGGRRVVLVEERGPWAASWLMLASWALPRELTPSLTFTTYDGRPRASDALVCVTTTGCDVGFQTHELAHKVALLRIADDAPESQPTTLFGRCVEQVTATGGATGLTSAADEVARLHGTVEAGELGPAYALSIAVSAPRTAAGTAVLIADEDVPAVLALATPLLDGRVTSSGLCAIGDLLAELAARPAAESGTATWVELHRLARSHADEDAQDVAGAALVALAARVSELDFDNLAPVSPASRVSPPPLALAAWLDTLEDAHDGSAFAVRLRAVQVLGLLGANSEMDRRLGELIASFIDAPAIQVLIGALLDDPHAQGLSESALVALARAAGRDEVAYAALAGLPRVAEARAIVEHVAEPGDFELNMTLGRLRVTSEPGARATTVVSLLTAASAESEVARVIATFYGSPATLGDAAEMLEVHHFAGRRPTGNEIAAAWHVLAGTSLRECTNPSTERLREALRAVDANAAVRPAELAFSLAERVRRLQSMQASAWIVDYLRLLDQRVALSSLHERELLERATSLVLRAPGAAAHLERFVALDTLLGEEFRAVYERLLARQGATEDTARLVGAAFETWTSTDPRRYPYAEDFLDRALPDVLSLWSPRDRELVSECIPEQYQDRWAEWWDEHPPPGTLNRMTRRMLRRKE